MMVAGWQMDIAPNATQEVENAGDADVQSEIHVTLDKEWKKRYVAWEKKVYSRNGGSMLEGQM